MSDPKAGGPSGKVPRTGLTPVDRVAAVSEAEFAALPIPRRLEILPYLQPSRRRACILACEDSAALVEAMQVQDLFLTVKEIGVHDAAGLVALMNGEQFRACVDFDGWARDEIDPDNAWLWLAVLGEAGVDRLMERVAALDFEVNVVLFAGLAKVFIAGEDFNPDEGTPHGAFTADGVHHLVFDCDPERRHLAETMITDLFQRDHDLYLRLLSAVRDGMTTQVQEEALRWRTARLADLGFPDYVEALKVYARVEKRKERRDLKLDLPAGDVPPSFAILRHDGFSLVPLDALARLGADESAAVAAGAAHLVNWLAVADRIDPGDHVQVRDLMEKARGYVAIGLRECGGDPAKVLAGTPLIDVFRAGFGRALDLAERAKKIVAEHPLVAGDRKALRLDEVSRETVAALLQARPLLYRGAVKSGAAGTGHFSSDEEIAAVGSILDKVDASAEIFGSVLKVFKRDVVALDIKGLNVPSRDDLTITRLFNTALARKLLRGGWGLDPVPAADLKKLHKTLFVVAGGHIDVSQAVADAAGEVAAAVEAKRPDLRRPAMQFMNACIEELKDNFGAVDLSAEVKPEFVGALLIRA